MTVLLPQIHRHVDLMIIWRDMGIRVTIGLQRPYTNKTSNLWFVDHVLPITVLSLAALSAKCVQIAIIFLNIVAFK